MPVFPFYLQYLYYDIAVNTESIQKTSQNIELLATVKTTRNVVMFSL